MTSENKQQNIKTGQHASHPQKKWRSMKLNETEWDNVGRDGTRWDDVRQCGTIWDDMGHL